MERTIEQVPYVDEDEDEDNKIKPSHDFWKVPNKVQEKPKLPNTNAIISITPPLPLSLFRKEKK